MHLLLVFGVTICGVSQSKQFKGISCCIVGMKKAESRAGFLRILPTFRLVFCICYSLVLRIVLFLGLVKQITALFLNFYIIVVVFDEVYNFAL
jgi:hypothetical protein